MATEIILVFSILIFTIISLGDKGFSETFLSSAHGQTAKNQIGSSAQSHKTYQEKLDEAGINIPFPIHLGFWKKQVADGTSG